MSSLEGEETKGDADHGGVKEKTWYDDWQNLSSSDQYERIKEQLTNI
jgi:hypothetical protein